jgi:hypothetical protein
VTRRPILTVSKSGDNVVISWSPSGGTLQSATNLLGTNTVWSTVGTANPATLSIQAGNFFLRVSVP